MNSARSHSTLRFGAAAIEQMSREDCLTLLTKTTTVGRIAFRSSMGQQLLPVNFAVNGDRVYIATAAENVLSELADGQDDVAFEIDYVDRMTQHGWSVVAHGTTRAAEPGAAELPGFRLPRPWAPGSRDLLIEFNPLDVSGRRIRNDIPPRE